MNAPIMPDIAQFNPPSLDAVERATALARLYFRPQYFGLDNVDAHQPALYVSNHTIYGVLDSPLLYEKLYKEKGIVLRSLGDHLHFDVPVWRDILQRGRAQAVIVMAGGNGSWLLVRGDEQARHFGCAQLGRDIVDTNGAGDSFVSAFLFSRLGGQPYAACMEAGAVSGAYACGCIGTHEEFITPALLQQYRCAA